MLNDVKDVREYFFGDHVITVWNSGYLAPDRIKHYEDVLGKLKYVKYHGKTILAD